jgi:hypothetical protein
MSRFAPPPPPERIAEVEATLRAKLEAAAANARRREAADNDPERLAERLAEHGWQAFPPSDADAADVRSLRPA